LTESAKADVTMGAEIDILGVSSTMVASSRISNPTSEQVTQGFVGSVPEMF
jgi:hypothetical protein